MMIDPLDQLGLTHTPGQAAFDDDEPTPPKGYGHIPANSAAPSRDSYPIARVQIRRDVFWQNVCRETLMALAGAATQSSGRLNPGPSAAQSSVSPVDELFDGRMGVITSQGQRIPIADVIPVFAFSVTGCDADRSRSNDVQCTVFRITTPTGETYTLPISQIVGVHTLSDSLIEQFEDGEDQTGEDDENRVPFGFSAYTSMVRSEEQANQHHQQQPSEQPDAPHTPQSPGQPPASKP